jgi:2-amino-4-hydroxy-6-hydroxymethyldihydropteridine diphosphokinase
MGSPLSAVPLHDARGRRCHAWIGLGANLGDAAATLRAAFAALSALPRTRLLARSSLYRTAPVDATGPDYLNAVAQIATGLSAQELLAQLHAIERQHGRERPFRNAPRTLDLDLLVYGDEVISTPELTVPHPRLRQRAFVLVPLAEVAPALEVPGLGAIAGLLPGVADQAIERLTGTAALRRKAAKATTAANASSAVDTHKPRRAP